MYEKDVLCHFLAWKRARALAYLQFPFMLNSTSVLLGDRRHGGHARVGYGRAKRACSQCHHALGLALAR